MNGYAASLRHLAFRDKASPNSAMPPAVKNSNIFVEVPDSVIFPFVLFLLQDVTRRIKTAYKTCPKIDCYLRQS